MRSMDLRVKRNATGAILNLTHIRMYDKLPFIAINLFTSRAVTFFDLPSLALIAKLNFFCIPEEDNGCNSLEKHYFLFIIYKGLAVMHGRFETNNPGIY